MNISTTVYACVRIIAETMEAFKEKELPLSLPVKDSRRKAK